MYSVSITEFPVNRTLTYHFDKLKEAYEFLKVSKRMYSNAYFVLYFDVR